jgi:hypothetical protein
LKAYDTQGNALQVGDIISIHLSLDDYHSDVEWHKHRKSSGILSNSVRRYYITKIGGLSERDNYGVALVCVDIETGHTRKDYKANSSPEHRYWTLIKHPSLNVYSSYLSQLTKNVLIA